jgi:peptide/nickel transport system permease protein
MREYILRRLLLIPLIIVGVSFLTFMTFRVIPGDTTVFICGFGCTDEVIADLQKDLGLDHPVMQQYWDWLKGVRQNWNDAFRLRWSC